MMSEELSEETSRACVECTRLNSWRKVAQYVKVEIRGSENCEESKASASFPIVRGIESALL